MDERQHSLFGDEGTPAPLPWAKAPELAFAQWISQAISQRGGRPYTPVSMQQYRSMWKQYCAYLSDRALSVLDASPAVIDAFLQHRHGGNGASLAPVTLRRYLSLLDRVYAYLREQRLCRSNPARELARHYRQRLSPAAVAHLPSSLDERFVALASALPTDTWKQQRNRAMLLLLPGSGLTQNELLHLTEADLHLEEAVPYIEVPPHGQRPARAVSVSPFAVEAVADWVAYRRAHGLLTVELFPAKLQGGVLNGSTLYRHVGDILEQLGIAQQKGARRLRHTFALRQLKAGAPEAAVKDWLGLETDEMLERYRKLVPDRHGVTAV